MPEGVISGLGCGSNEIGWAVPAVIAVAPLLVRTNAVLASGVIATELGRAIASVRAIGAPAVPGDPIGATLLMANGTPPPLEPTFPEVTPTPSMRCPARLRAGD